MSAIKKLRKQKKWSQKQLADKLNIHQTAVSQWETGRSYPDIEIAIKLSEIFNVSIDYLIKGENCPCTCKKKNILLTVREHILIDDFRELNKEGQDKCLSLIDDIVKCGKYKRGTKSDADSPNSSDVKHVG